MLDQLVKPPLFSAGLNHVEPREKKGGGPTRAATACNKGRHRLLQIVDGEICRGYTDGEISRW